LSFATRTPLSPAARPATETDGAAPSAWIEEHLQCPTFARPSPDVVPAIVALWPPIRQFIDQQAPERRFVCLKSAPSAILIFRRRQLTAFAKAWAMAAICAKRTLSETRCSSASGPEAAIQSQLETSF
jgi:hypothetical protein